MIESGLDMGEAVARVRKAQPSIVLGIPAATAAIAASTALILSRQRLLAGVAALVATGAIALVSTSAQRRSVFAARALDRVFEASLLSAVAWIARGDDVVVAALALVGLGASYLASYQRARGLSLGYRGWDRVGVQVAREALVAFGLLTGWLQPFLWAFVALAVAFAAARASSVAAQERRRRIEAGGGG